MLNGDKVLLRPLERDDVGVLAGWAQDYETWPQVNEGPYAPTSVADALRDYDAPGSDSRRASATVVPFAIDVDDELVGSIALWGIDLHNRRGHLGIGLGPSHRGKGYGRDAIGVLLRYAFVDRGLHRVQLEVLADNERALRSYRAAGFREDGRLRESAWVMGSLVDEVIMSVLATDAPR